ncbi:MAG TPA: PAS domain S-box protein [Cyclobacteriaceae bacterium]|nr:PAS domain S-box protein [Cyclobacteriaceae bacterium]HRJ80307.1 PAS domain S-box protein [Cyclobacteriaceae bacterium]
MQELFHNLPGVIYEYVIRKDGSRLFTYISENSIDILGLRADELRKDSSLFRQILLADDRASFKDSLNASHEGRKTWNWEGRITVNGAIRWIETRSNPVVSSEDIKRKGIIIDITERKQLEQEQVSQYQSMVENRVKEQIKKNEILFTQLFNNIPMAVVMLDANGKVELVNKGFSNIFGFELSELKGKNLNDFIVPAELQNEGMDLNNVISAQGIIQVETFRKRKTGERVDVLLYGMPILSDDKVLGIYGVYVDVTSHRMMEEELKVRNAELDNFVYKVSHDLRAPLSSILGLVNLSKLPGNTDDPAMYINIIGDKVQALDHFISDVLSHSKNLKLDVKYDHVDVKSILTKTIEDLSYLEGAKEVEFDIAVEVDCFYTDPWRISEIFRNLVSNAIKYRTRGTHKPKVQVRIVSDKDWVKIVFADNGIGIAKQNLDHIFEMFYRATEQSDGSGIGLYIVKNAVEKLEGRIKAESQEDMGTTFYIELPNRVNEGEGAHS